MELVIALLEAAPLIEGFLSQLVLEGEPAKVRDDLVVMFQRAAAGPGEITAEERAQLKAETTAQMERLRALVEARQGGGEPPTPEAT